MKKEMMGLREIQQTSLAIAKYLHQLCAANGIQYWVFYGTLLGAVRHQGFIPWDDDLDIAMHRSDYDRFLEIMKREDPSSPYYLDHYTVCDDYPYYIARVCDRRTHLDFDSNDHKSGVFVDIYPFDDSGGDASYWKRHLSYSLFLKKCLVLSARDNIWYGRNLTHKVLNIPLAAASKAIGSRALSERMDRYSRQFNGRNSGFIDQTGCAEYPKSFDEKLFREFVELPFEDTALYAPKEYDRILHILYGDYMQLPPEADRHPTHYYSACRLETES